MKSSDIIFYKRNFVLIKQIKLEQITQELIRKISKQHYATDLGHNQTSELKINTRFKFHEC